MTKNERVVSKYIKRWLSEKSIARMAAGSGPIPRSPFTPDVVIQNWDTAPITDPYHGDEGVRQWCRDLIDPIEGGWLELGEVLESSGDWVVVSSFVRGRMRHTEIDLKFPFFQAFQVRDGLIAHGQGCLSREDALAVVRSHGAPAI